MYELLKELNNTGKLQELVNAGIVSTKISNHFDMYEMYLKNLSNTYIKNKPKAIEKTSIDCNLCDRSIYNVISRMES